MRIVPLSKGQSATRVVSIASGKGGVGKTSLTINLAWSLAARGNRVCILDADLGLSNVDILLGVTPPKTLEDVLFGQTPLCEAIINVAPGVDLVSGASGVPKLAELPLARRRQLVNDFTTLDDYDYLIVDNSPGITGQIVSLCLSSRDIAIVVNPDATSITDAYALIKVLAQNGLWWTPLILVNRARSRQQARLIFEKIRATAGKHLHLNCSFLGHVSEDDAVFDAAAKQRPLLEAAPLSVAARDIDALAKTLDQMAPTGRRRDVTPGRFLDSSVMRLKQDNGALMRIARTTRQFKSQAQEAPPLDVRALLGGLKRLSLGLDRLEEPNAYSERNRVAGAMRKELAAMRALLADSDQPSQPKVDSVGDRVSDSALAPAPQPGTEPCADVAPKPPRGVAPKPAKPVRHARPKPTAPVASPTPEPQPAPQPQTALQAETLPGINAALSALNDAHSPNLPEEPEEHDPRALLVCPPSPMRDVLCEVLERSGLTPEPVHPRQLNGGNHFEGFRMGLVCWEAPPDDLEKVVRKAGNTPVVMLRGFRRKPEDEFEFTAPGLTVLYKPFQVADLSGTIRRVTNL